MPESNLCMVAQECEVVTQHACAVTVAKYSPSGFYIASADKSGKVCIGAGVSNGNGYINDYPTGRLLRDAKLFEIGGGTSEVRRMVIGRSINAEYS